MSSTREKAEAILQDVLARIEALKAEALAEIEEVRKDAEEKVARYEDAREELAEVEEEIVSLEARQDELPVEVTRANLAERFDLELELREEYRAIGPRLEELEDRVASLKGELAKIDRRAPDGPPPHPNDAYRREYGRVSGTAAEHRRAVEDLRKRLLKGIDAALDPIAKQHDQYRGLVQSWGEERKLDPEQREWLERQKAREASTYREQESARERMVQAQRQRENSARVLASGGPRDEEE